MNTTARIEHSSTPDAEFRYFVYCPNDGDFTYYKSAAERDKGADMVIQRYLDDGWDEMVEQVVAGELTHTCGQVGREDRPAESELDAEQCDADGKHWGEWDYTCNYDLIALPAAPVAPLVVPDLILPSAAVEGDELVIRIDVDTLCHAVTMADNWPTDYKGESCATIVNRALFVKELMNELQRENEQGATPLHFLFDEAALAAIEAGSEAVEFHEDAEEDDE